MAVLVCITILWVAGFLTVATEAFTHFVIFGSWRETLKEFALQSVIFSGTAIFWAVSVWFGLWWNDLDRDLELLLGVLGASHLPLLAYPLTIIPTVGFRLEQFLRLLVYGLFVTGLTYFSGLTFALAAMVCLPGWMLHFLTLESRLLRRNRTPA